MEVYLHSFMNWLLYRGGRTHSMCGHCGNLKKVC